MRARPEIFLLWTPAPLPQEVLAVCRQRFTLKGYDVLACRSGANDAVPASKAPRGAFLTVFAVQNLSSARAATVARDIGRRMKNFQPRILAAKSDMLNIFFSDAHDILAQAEKNEAAFASPYPVLRALGRKAARTRVEVVDFRGVPAVCKTFRPSVLENLRREIAAREKLGGKIPAIAPALEEGGNYFIMPLYDPEWKWQEDGPALYPLNRARACMALLRQIHAAGYAIVDAHPGNFIFDRKEGVRLADLEYFLAQPDGTPFEESFDIAGVPVGYADNIYPGGPVTYRNAWFPVLGVSLHDLMHASSLRLRFLRIWHLAFRHLPKVFWKRLKKTIERLFKRNEKASLKEDFVCLWPRGF